MRHEVEHRHGRVVWHAFGSGPPLVLIHGGHGDWRHWIRNVEALAASHQLWLPDIPGYGESDSLADATDSPAGLELLAAALRATADSLIGPDTTFDLAAFSFGALVAAKFAQGRRVRRMALVGAVGHRHMRNATSQLLRWRSLPPAQRPAALRHNLGAFMLHDPTVIDAATVALYQSQCEATRFRSSSLSLGGTLPELLDQLPVPLLMIWGEHDATTETVKVATDLARGRADRQLQLIRAAGHWVQYERPREVDALLLDWFDRS